MGHQTAANEMILVSRLTALDDLSPAIDLLQRFFREEGFDTPNDVISRNTRTMAGLDVCGLFQATAEGGVIGVATVSLDFGIEFGWSAEMGDLYVVPEWRGKGVSLALVKSVEAFLQSKGVCGYQVTITPIGEAQQALSRFYDRLGFQDEGRILRYRALS
jgi:GNAT superfamily N-acetyltransferase